MLRNNIKENLVFSETEALTHLEGGQIDSGNKSYKKSLNVVCIAIGAMGHFLPVLNCATALR